MATTVFASVAMALSTALAFWQFAKAPVPPYVALLCLPVELLILYKLSSILEERRGYKHMQLASWRLAACDGARDSLKGPYTPRLQ